MQRPVPYVDLAAQYASERSELLAVIDAALARGDWVGGNAVDAFEAELSAYLGITHAVALNSGTDALILVMRALGIGPGDEVITAPTSFIASAGAVAMLGATPVFADVGDDLNLDPAAVAKAITPRTKALIPVHLAGRIADMDPLMELAAKHGLAVIEDAAQAVGSCYKGKMAGGIGIAGCFSAHPLKNLNACGDAGFVTTNDSDLAARLKRLRAHGLIDRNTAVEWGTVSRLDTLQAEILRLRLKKLDQVIAKRRTNAQRYRDLLAGAPVELPQCRDFEFNTFHLFVIQSDDRDGLQAHLAARNIASGVHYPVPIHLQPAAKALGYQPGSLPNAERLAGRILSLPIHQHLADEDLVRVAEAILSFKPSR